MDSDASTQELVTTLILRSAQTLAEGNSLPQLESILTYLGAKPEVAHAIAIKAEAVHLARTGQL